MESTWNFWINEPIYESDRGLLFRKRKHVIADLCLKGLVPMMKEAGYRFRMANGDLVKQVLLLVFEVSRRKKVIPNRTDFEIPYAREQYAYFHHCIDTEVWLDFWDVWGGIQDFHESPLRFQLPEFVWSWVDLEKSPTVIQFEKDLQEEDYHEEVSKGKDDPYLQDTLKRDFQDRHWF